ncbi:MAG: tail fiber protein [Deltaproteobacteria bacterium]|nr:tail fiber protein [Deltaproteobacteria bacterium]
MAEPFLGEIRIFGFSFNPRGWAYCSGQLLSIGQYSALYSLLGTYYGGDGRSTFGVPDLRGRVPISFGQGPGLSHYPLAYRGGLETVQLQQAQMPVHTHTATPDLKSHTPAKSGAANVSSPGGNAPAEYTVGTERTPENLYSDTPDTTLKAGEVDGTIAVGEAGGSQMHENRQPYLALNYCIALDGLYPSRN